jgi:hypothetical protein
VGIDIAAQLAGTVVTQFLVPYLKKGAKKLSDMLAGANNDATTGSDAGQVDPAAAEHVDKTAEEVWKRIQSAMSTPDEVALMKQFERFPVEAQALIKSVLAQKLHDEPDLASQLDKLVHSKGPDGVSAAAHIENAGIAAIVMAQGANFSGSTGVTVAGNIFGAIPSGGDIPKPPQPEPRPSGQ